MRVLVCGGRDYMDQEKVWRTLDEMHMETPISGILEGGATGADAWALTWAHSSGVLVWSYKADWKTHGRSAGPKRNAKMILEGRPDVVVAFPGGRGTADCIKASQSRRHQGRRSPLPLSLHGEAVMRILLLGIYLGIGAMCHAMFIGPHFDWSSAWTFGWLFGWPVVVAIYGFALLIVFSVIITVVWGCIELVNYWRPPTR